MNLHDTVPIAFNSGTYGTYLEWVLTTLTTDIEISAPFAHAGTSHAYLGRHLLDMSGWQNYVNAQQYVKFVRLHPKNKQTESLSQNLESILDQVDTLIYLYPGRDTEILAINNYLSKTQHNWWTHHVGKDISPDFIYQNWPISASVPIDQVPRWIQREFLSFYLLPAWRDQVEWFHPESWQHQRCLTLTVNDLLFDLEGTMNRIGQFCHLTYTKRPAQLLGLHGTMLGLQENLGQDSVCQQVVQHTTNQQDFAWDPLPLASESWVQWQLRNLGFEIRCDGLDSFPTNSQTLYDLLYQT